MKRNKFFKSLLVSFLALAMVFTVGTVKAHADGDGGGTTPSPSPTPAPVEATKFEATFTATNNGTSYTYKVTGSDKKLTVKLEDIMKNLKSSDGGKPQDLVLLDIKDKATDPATVLTTTNLDTDGKVLTIPGFTGTATDTENKIEKLSFTVELGPAKVDAIFKDSTYTATIKVDNPKNVLAKLDKIEVSLSEISKNLKKISGGAAPDSEQVVTAITGGKANAENKDLVEIALTGNAIPEAGYEITVVPAFGAVAYDPATDSITIANVPEGVTLKYAIVKADAESKVSGSAFKDVPDGAKGTVNSETKKYTVTFSLSDKTKGINVAPTKDTLIYFTALTPNAEKTHYAPTITVKAAIYSKIKVNLNYAVAEEGGTALGVASIDVTTAATKVKSTETEATTLAKLSYSADGGTTWTAIGAETGGFTAAKLYTYVIKDKAEKVLFRFNGSAATTDPAAEAVRNSKPISVSIKVAGKAAKSIKLDVKKCTLAIKNGYDYSVQTTKVDNDGIPALSAWMTILPFNKSGSATGTELATSAYVPVAKFSATDAAKYTATKVTGKDVLAEFSANASAPKLFFYVRKSATAAKPAQKATVVEIAKQAAFSTSTLAYGVTAGASGSEKKYYAVADEKGTLTIPTLTKASESDSFEYAIVLKADYNATADAAKIDWSTIKWTKMAEGKTIVVGKSATSYKLVGAEEAKKVVLADGTKADEACYIVVRKAGDSKKGILPSLNLVTEVVTKAATAENPVNVVVWEDLPASTD